MYLRHMIFHVFSFTASILKIEIFRQVENLIPKKGVLLSPTQQIFSYIMARSN